MNHPIVLTFIADDKPGVIELLARTIRQHNGNWLESRMTELAGKFAGIVRVDASSAQVVELRSALTELKALGLSVTVEDAISKADSTATNNLHLSLMGPDRSGIVHQITQTLAEHGLNVTEMESFLTSAAMSGEALFHVNATVHAAADLKREELEDRLYDCADELGVDIELVDAD